MSSVRVMTSTNSVFREKAKHSAVGSSVIKKCDEVTEDSTSVECFEIVICNSM